MAMRPRASGAVRPRPAMHPTNENFKPRSIWKHEEGASILSVYLPGFVKEQIKLTFDEPTRFIRVQGQRSLPNARWIRFNEGFSIPENCDISKINSQFLSGVFRIIMPKIVTNEISPKQEAKNKTTQNVEAQNGQEVTPPKAISTPSTEKQKDEQSVKALSPPKSTSEPKSQKGEKETPSKPISTTGIEEKRGEKNLEVRSLQIKAESKPKSQNGQDESPPKTISTTDASEHKVENILGSKSVDQKTDEKKEKSEKSGGDYEGKAKEDSKKALKGLDMGLNENRQLLVKVGSAVLVIVVLGAYIFSSFRS